MHFVRVIRGVGAPTIYSSDAVKTVLPPKRPADYIPGDVQEVRRDTLQPRTTSTPTTSTTPTGAPSCNDLWNSLMAQALPAVRTCLNSSPQHKATFDAVCNRIVTGQTSLQTGTMQWASYVDRACNPQQPQTVVRQPTPPAQPPPPPTGGSPTLEPPPPVIDVPTGGDPGGSDVPEEQSHLRQLGSIVGIGLILAVGLTYARKKGMLKLTKRRRRR